MKVLILALSVLVSQAYAGHQAEETKAEREDDVRPVVVSKKEAPTVGEVGVAIIRMKQYDDSQKREAPLLLKAISDEVAKAQEEKMKTLSDKFQAAATFKEKVPVSTEMINYAFDNMEHRLKDVCENYTDPKDPKVLEACEVVVNYFKNHRDGIQKQLINNRNLYALLLDSKDGMSVSEQADRYLANANHSYAQDIPIYGMRNNTSALIPNVLSDFINLHGKVDELNIKIQEAIKEKAEPVTTGKEMAKCLASTYASSTKKIDGTLNGKKVSFYIGKDGVNVLPEGANKKDIFAAKSIDSEEGGIKAMQSALTDLITLDMMRYFSAGQYLGSRHKSLTDPVEGYGAIRVSFEQLKLINDFGEPAKMVGNLKSCLRTLTGSNFLVANAALGRVEKKDVMKALEIDYRMSKLALDPKTPPGKEVIEVMNTLPEIKADYVFPHVEQLKAQQMIYQAMALSIELKQREATYNLSKATEEFNKRATILQKQVGEQP